MAGLEQILQTTQAEMFFCGLPVFVEGPEDVAYLSAYLRATGRWGEFRQRGGHLVAVDGKTNMSRPLAIAQLLGIRAFSVFDGDAKCKDEDRPKHERDNRCLLRLAGMDTESFCDAPIIGGSIVMWPTNIGDAVKASAGDGWGTAAAVVREKHGFHGIGKKNPLLIAATVMEYAEKVGKIPVLEAASGAILKYAIVEQ